MGAAENPAEALGSRVISGARWVLLLRLGSMGSLWIISIALARLLDRSQFGLAGMANTAIAILTVFQESGLRGALIHRSTRMQEAVDAAVVYAAASCLAMAAVCLVAAPVAGAFFHQHEVTSLVRGLSIVFVFRAVSQVPQAILEKELRFRPLALVILSGSVVQATVAITLGASGAGAWSALIGSMALEGWCAAFLWPISGIRPRPRRASFTTLRELLRYGRSLVGANIGNTIYMYVDNAVVGRFLGPIAVGAYSIGYQVGKQPVATVALASNQLVFPTFALLQNDMERFRRVYLRSLRFIVLVSAPVGFGLAAASGTFVHVVYGHRWKDAAPVLAIMALAGVVLSATSPMGEVMKARNRPGLLFALSALEAAIAVAACLLLYPHGIAAVAGGIAVTVVIVGVLAAMVTMRLLGIRMGELVSTLAPALVAAVVAGLAVFGSDLGLQLIAPPIRLILDVVECVVVYGIALRIVSPTSFFELLRELDRLSAISSIHRRLRPVEAE